MESSLFSAVVSRKDLPQDRLFEELETLKPGLFTDLLQMEHGAECAKTVLLYIIYAYSKESPLVVLGEGLSELKRRIADFVGLPDHLLGPVVQMQDGIVRDVVVDYLAAQKDRRWQHLMQDKEVYQLMSDGLVQNFHREDGTIDVKGIVDAAKHRKELLHQIETQEEAFRMDGEYGTVQDTIDDLKKLGKGTNGHRSIRLENSQHIR